MSVSQSWSWRWIKMFTSPWQSRCRSFWAEALRRSWQRGLAAAFTCLCVCSVSIPYATFTSSTHFRRLGLMFEVMKPSPAKSQVREQTTRLQTNLNVRFCCVAAFTGVSQGTAGRTGTRAPLAPGYEYGQGAVCLLCCSALRGILMSRTWFYGESGDSCRHLLFLWRSY